MRTALASTAQRGARQKSLSVRNIPAPVGGWNAKDPLAQMDQLDAVSLVNWFPRQADCEIRGGAEDHATGLTTGKSLVTYAPAGSGEKLFAIQDSGVYDVSAAGAIGAAVSSALTSGWVNETQMSTAAGHFLMLFNGVDKPLYYEGTVWTSVDGASSPSITGISTPSIVSANVYKRRLFFVISGSLSTWYLPVDQVGGAAIEFTLGPLCRKGGFLMACGTWTFDSGTGPDDYIVFVTSEGEIIVYTGTNPSSSIEWALVGVYNVAKPIGRRCLMKYGGDLLLLTEEGVLPMSKALTTSDTAASAFALTDKINSAFTSAVRTATLASPGWETVLFPSHNALITNIVGSQTNEQYVMNTLTKAWCRFSGWNARSFTVFNKELYFIQANKVAKAWTGQSDFGADIQADAQQAYNYFGSRGSTKSYELFRPHLISSGPLDFSHALSVDFDPNVTLSTAVYSSAGVDLWDVGLWDVAVWSADSISQKDWQTPVGGVGYCASLLFRIATNTIAVRWVASDFGLRTGVGVVV